MMRAGFVQPSFGYNTSSRSSMRHASLKKPAQPAAPLFGMQPTIVYHPVYYRPPEPENKPFLQELKELADSASLIFAVGAGLWGAATEGLLPGVIAGGLMYGSFKLVILGVERGPSILLNFAKDKVSSLVKHPETQPPSFSEAKKKQLDEIVNFYRHYQLNPGETKKKQLDEVMDFYKHYDLNPDESKRGKLDELISLYRNRYPETQLPPEVGNNPVATTSIARPTQQSETRPPRPLGRWRRRPGIARPAQQPETQPPPEVGNNPVATTSIARPTQQPLSGCYNLSSSTALPIQRPKVQLPPLTEAKKKQLDAVLNLFKAGDPLIDYNGDINQLLNYEVAAHVGEALKKEGAQGEQMMSHLKLGLREQYLYKSPHMKREIRQFWDCVSREAFGKGLIELVTGTPYGLDALLNVNPEMKGIKSRLEKQVLQPHNRFLQEKARLQGLPVREKSNTNVIFYGPSGTGKTHLVQRLAQELQIKKPVEVYNSDILQEHVGSSNRRLKELFENAARRGKPSMIIMNEFDLGGRRDNTAKENNFTREMTNLLINMMDKSRKDGVMLATTTNQLKSVDPAILERFSVRNEVPLPNHEGRRLFLKNLLPSTLGEDELTLLSHLSEGLSTRELKYIIEPMLDLNISNNSTLFEALGKEIDIYKKVKTDAG